VTIDRSCPPRDVRAAAAGLAIAGIAALVGVAVLPMSALPAVAARPASATQDYGPYTCLTGYVWREAVTNDVVCVTPDVRTQTRQDNALAASRRNPSGPFGPDTCIQGYVWREAVANDRVCVTPATREQARADNLRAASRRNDVRTTVTASGSPTQYNVRTDRINIGQGYLGLYRSATGARIRSWSVPVRPHATSPGGLLNVRTPIQPCTGPTNAYFRVRDGSSTRWSSRRYVCAAA
jgi:hypothetical protein